MTATQSALALPADGGTVFIPGPAGRIEAMVDLPEPQAARRGIAVFAHPNPPEGGTMHNKVVTMSARALAECGIAVVRFNFRGAGQSEGAFDNGRGEMLDLLAVARWVQAARPGDALWLGGFSFGSWVALQAARQLPVKQMISVAPPVGFRDFTGVPAAGLPVAADPGRARRGRGRHTRCSSGSTKQSPAPTVVRMPETGHFFHRRLLDLRGAIKNGVRKNLPPLVPSLGVVTPSATYAAGLAEGRWQADAAQQALLPELDAIRAQLLAAQPASLLDRLAARFRETEAVPGLYLWGASGAARRCCPTCSTTASATCRGGAGISTASWAKCTRACVRCRRAPPTPSAWWRRISRRTCVCCCSTNSSSATSAMR